MALSPSEQRTLQRIERDLGSELVLVVLAAQLAGMSARRGAAMVRCARWRRRRRALLLRIAGNPTWLAFTAFWMFGVPSVLVAGLATRTAATVVVSVLLVPVAPLAVAAAVRHGSAGHHPGWAGRRPRARAGPGQAVVTAPPGNIG